MRGPRTKEQILYSRYKGMMGRCYRPKCNGYKYYGGKGITVCKEWAGHPRVFIEWSLKNGFDESLLLDREDGTKGYSPENCRWATQKEQLDNRAITVYIETPNGPMTVPDAASHFGINKNRLWKRVKSGKKDLFTQDLLPRRYKDVSKNRFITTPQGEMTIGQAARVFGIPGDTLRNRVRSGHTDLFAPVRKWVRAK